MNIDHFETRKVKRRTTATFLEEEKISKLCFRNEVKLYAI